MATTVHPEAWIDPGTARAYLQDQNLSPDDDMLIEHINATTAIMLDYCGRESWKVVEPTDTTPPLQNVEVLLDPTNKAELYLRHWPLLHVHSVEERIRYDDKTTLDGPTDWPEKETDDFMWDDMGGIYKKKGGVWYGEEKKSIRVKATVGYFEGKNGALALRGITLDVLAWHYQRWLRRADGMETVSVTDVETLSFSAAELPEAIQKQLNRYALGAGVF